MSSTSWVSVQLLLRPSPLLRATERCRSLAGCLRTAVSAARALGSHGAWRAYHAVRLGAYFWMLMTVLGFVAVVCVLERLPFPLLA